MRVLIFAFAFLLSVFSADLGSAYEIPEKYTESIVGIDFYPTGARFVFNVDPYDKEGNFKAFLPGAFDENSIRLLNPDFVYGDIHVERLSRTPWVPSGLSELDAEIKEQQKKLDALKTRESALQHTLTLLKDLRPEKSDPDKLLDYIKNSQAMKFEAENEFAEIKSSISAEQEKLKALTTEFNSRKPRNENSFLVLTGKADSTVEFSAFTNSASWKLNYILNLNSDNGEIEVSRIIKASQRTGLDFKGDMTMHTKVPDENITTPNLNPLRVGIKPKSEPVVKFPNVQYSRTNRMYKSVQKAEEDAYEELPADMLMSMETGAAPEAFAEPEIIPDSETLSDRIIYVDSEIKGDGVQTELAPLYGLENLKSSVIITMIPEQRNNAWIIASMDEKNESLIPGSAELRVDGNTAGKIHIGEYGESQRSIPFGYAEQITVKKESLVGKKGVSWFSGVFTSGYKLEITNGTRAERIITVRDRLPIPTDEKIKLDVKRIEPKEKERDKENRLTWEITVPAGATFPIIVDYTLSYPSGEELQYR